MTARTGQRARPRRAAAGPATVDVSLDPFTFEHEGREYTLPSFANLPFGLVRRIRNLPEAEAIFQTFETVADEDTLAALDSMGGYQVGLIVRDWQTHAGVSLGELQRSSTSSKSTPQRSRTTGVPDSA